MTSPSQRSTGDVLRCYLVIACKTIIELSFSAYCASPHYFFQRLIELLFRDAVVSGPSIHLYRASKKLSPAVGLRCVPNESIC